MLVGGELVCAAGAAMVCDLPHSEATNSQIQSCVSFQFIIWGKNVY